MTSTSPDAVGFVCLLEVGKMVPYMVGVAGGSCAGKVDFCKIVKDYVESTLSDSKVLIIGQERFYKDFDVKSTNPQDFDHPNSLDECLMCETLTELKNGKIVKVHNYDLSTHKRSGEITLNGSDYQVILMEGILSFYFAEIRNLFDFRIFVDVDSDLRLVRRVQRDQVLGRELSNILNQYIHHVKPNFEDFCLPTRKYAHVTVPRGITNEVAMNVVKHHIFGEVTGRMKQTSIDNAPEVSDKKKISSTSIISDFLPH